MGKIFKPIAGKKIRSLDGERTFKFKKTRGAEIKWL